MSEIGSSYTTPHSRALSLRSGSPHPSQHISSRDCFSGSEKGSVIYRQSSNRLHAASFGDSAQSDLLQRWPNPQDGPKNVWGSIKGPEIAAPKMGPKTGKKSTEWRPSLSSIFLHCLSFTGPRVSTAVVFVGVRETMRGRFSNWGNDEGDDDDRSGGGVSRAIKRC